MCIRYVYYVRSALSSFIRFQHRTARAARYSIPLRLHSISYHTCFSQCTPRRWLARRATGLVPFLYIRPSAFPTLAQGCFTCVSALKPIPHVKSTLNTSPYRQEGDQADRCGNRDSHNCRSHPPAAGGHRAALAAFEDSLQGTVGACITINRKCYNRQTISENIIDIRWYI